MTVITLARKTPEGTVASNAQKYGTGGINIDECRVFGGPSLGGPISGVSALGQGSGWNSHNNVATDIDRSMPSGRWPANLILEHKSECKCVGERKVKTGEPDNGSEMNHQVYGDRKTLGRVCGFAGEDGTETVTAWDCVPGCPVAELDRQSGSIPTQANRSDPKSKLKGRNEYFGLNGRTEGPPEYLGETGGASRFFKQVQEGPAE